mgnify:CR=1 FL=1
MNDYEESIGRIEVAPEVLLTIVRQEVLSVEGVNRMAPIPAEARADEGLWCECVSGAEEIGALEAMLREAGFQDVLISPQGESRDLVRSWAPGAPAAELVVSAIIEAWKP